MLPVHDLDVPPDELRFHRLSGRVSLDLVATIGERWRGRFERLRTPEDLDRWLVGTLDISSPTADVDHLEEARRLRGAIELLVVAAIDGSTMPEHAARGVNEFAASPTPVPLLATDGSVGHETPTRGDPVRSALSLIARDAIDVFGSDLRARVRECEADDCALVFLDTSRGRRRRWCSMKGCGNRAKVRRHRAGE